MPATDLEDARTAGGMRGTPGACWQQLLPIHGCLRWYALVRLFARACQRAGIRQAWVTPHALRHTHATRMWEGGMRELTLQRRLGHALVESTRVYIRISDPVVVADYRRALGCRTDHADAPTAEVSS